MVLQWEGELRAYQAYLRSLGRSNVGIKKYTDDIRYFIRSLGPGAKLSDISVEMIIRCQEKWSTTCKGGTIGNRLTAIRSFSRYLVLRNILQTDPTDKLKWPTKEDPETWPLTKGELAQLLKVLTVPGELSERQEFIYRRNRRAIFLMLYAGLRISEASAIIRRSINLEDNVLIVQRGKYGRRRELPIHPALAAEIEATTWLRPSWPVAGTINNTPLAVKSMAHIFEIWLPARGIMISAHQLRRTFATQLLRNGAQLRDIQVLLGHRSLKTTAAYLGVNTQDLEDSLNKLPSEW